MTVKDAVLEKLDRLPIVRQQEVLDFAEFLEQKNVSLQPRPTMYGILSDINVDITEDDIREMRNEAWKNFPREHIFDEETK